MSEDHHKVQLLPWQIKVSIVWDKSIKVVKIAWDVTFRKEIKFITLPLDLQDPHTNR